MLSYKDLAERIEKFTLSLFEYVTDLARLQELAETRATHFNQQAASVTWRDDAHELR